jgi:hypothetical protein
VLGAGRPVTRSGVTLIPLRVDASDDEQHTLAGQVDPVRPDAQLLAQIHRDVRRLFVLARYREEIAAGFAPGEARSRAMATSGLAVIFSGMTVIVSLAGLWMIDNNAVRSMALGASWWWRSR